MSFSSSQTISKARRSLLKKISSFLRMIITKIYSIMLTQLIRIQFGELLLGLGFWSGMEIEVFQIAADQLTMRIIKLVFTQLDVLVYLVLFIFLYLEGYVALSRQSRFFSTVNDIFLNITSKENLSWRRGLWTKTLSVQFTKLAKIFLFISKGMTCEVLRNKRY